MDTKLTLKLDQSVIHSAKIFAASHNRSLSHLVEDFFRNLITDTEPHRQFSPLVEELSGVVSEKEITKLEYGRYLEEKYE